MTTSSGGEKDKLPMRVISAALMIPAGLLVVWSGGEILLIAGLICGLLMWREVWDVSTSHDQSLLQWIGSVIFLATVLTVEVLRIPIVLTLAGLIIGASAVFLFARSTVALWLVCGLTLISVAVLGLLSLRGETADRLVMTIIVMASVWITDISAYFAGRGFGGPRLAPRNSPNKTWSGAAGAIICTALFGALAAGLIGAETVRWMLYCAIVSAVAQLGDLVESRWKRRFNAKDSGSIIPGHGGILDRLDSFTSVLVAHAVLLGIDPLFPENVMGLGG